MFIREHFNKHPAELNVDIRFCHCKLQKFGAGIASHFEEITHSYCFVYTFGMQTSFDLHVYCKSYLYEFYWVLGTAFLLFVG